MSKHPFAIEDVKTKKNILKERMPEYIKNHIIPSPLQSLMVVGASGSGKSVMINNLITKFWRDVVDVKDIILVSPTALSDDVLMDIGIPRENIFTDPLKGLEHCKKVFKIQDTLIKHLGADKCPIIVIYYDDVISNKKVIKDDFLIHSFIAGRHSNCGVILGSQNYKSLPPVARDQCSSVTLFQCNNATADKFADIFTPSSYNKQEFKTLLQNATSDPYSFLYINKSAPMKDRYMCRFEEKYELHRLKGNEPERPKGVKPPKGTKQDGENMKIIKTTI